MLIHSSHHSEWRAVRFILIPLLLAANLLVWLPLSADLGSGLANYAPLHIVLELAAVVVALIWLVFPVD